MNMLKIAGAIALTTVATLLGLLVFIDPTAVDDETLR